MINLPKDWPLEEFKDCKTQNVAKKYVIMSSLLGSRYAESAESWIGVEISMVRWINCIPKPGITGGLPCRSA